MSDGCLHVIHIVIISVVRGHGHLWSPLTHHGHVIHPLEHEVTGQPLRRGGVISETLIN